MLNLPNYTVLDKICETNHSVLYRVQRNACQSTAAVKVLKNDHPSPVDLAKLRHEYLIRREIGGSGAHKSCSLERHENRLALILEDAEGQLLSDHLSRQQLSLEAVLQIGISLARTLEQLHRQHIIHKDIKPQNILVDLSSHRVCLVDFSIATKLSQETQKMAAPDALEGTLAYMSPEQTGRMNRVIDHRSDLYALGSTLYQMLTGCLPFATTDAMELVHCHIARKPTPPHELRKELPKAVSGVVMKLLVKAAEERYQSAHGLREDLQECLHQLQATGQIVEFPLGRFDKADELRIAQKLYGRQAEVRTLLSAFERVGLGAAELLLVTGYSGVGKSALVNEIQKEISHRGGYFVSGKFDQFSRSVPYASIAQALRELIRHILTEQADRLSHWQRLLQAALGSNGQLLIDLVPELEVVIGSQPSVPALPPTEAQNRFNLVVLNFLHVFTTAEHPLIIFLDDLQWADAASLNLLEVLFTDSERGHLLLIGAYRDNEANADHPMRLLIERLQRRQVGLTEIKLKPLAESDVCELIADATGERPTRIAPLARVVFEKTHGNPFFVNQFLGVLHAERLLRYDSAAGSWVWQLAQVQARLVTDNVVDLMAGKLQQFAPETQDVLKLASCIGHQFGLHTLSTIHEKGIADTAAALWPALREGLIVPLDSNYRFVHGTDEAGPAFGELPDFKITYKFLHDRVQQAAYALIEEGKKHALHLKIGRLLRASTREAHLEEILFELTGHLNFGAPLLTDPAERLDLARLNLLAGKRAKVATAYQAAADYLTSAMRLLGEASWQQEYQLCFEIYLERAECEYLNRRFDLAESLFDTILSKVRSNLERAQICNLRMVLYSTLGKMVDTVHLGRAALALFGVTFPDDENAQSAALPAAFAEVHGSLGERRIEDLASSPLLVDAEQQMVLKLLATLTAPSYFINPSLFTLIILKQVSLSLKHGHSEASAFGYATYGMILAGILGRYKEAYAFGKLALSLNEKFNHSEGLCKLTNVFGGFISYFCQPMRLSLEYFERGNKAGLESGDFTFVSYNCLQFPVIRLGLGDELSAISEQCGRLLSLMQRTKDAYSSAFLTAARQMVENLRGHTRDRSTLSDARFDEAKFLAELGQVGLTTVVCWYYAIKLELGVLYEDHAAALEMAAKAEERAGNAVGFFFLTDLAFFKSLAAAALSSAAAAADKERYAKIVEEGQAKLANWSDHCAENFEHKYLLVQAEAARLAGKRSEAMELYDRAIQLSQERGFQHHAAMANELAGKYYLALGRSKVARTYLAEAHAGYLTWGATAKAAQLMAAHRSLLTEQMTQAGAETATPIDLMAVIRASQVLSGEMDLRRLLERLMTVVVENAGAEKGYLLIERDHDLFVDAQAYVEQGVVKVSLLSAPLAPASLPLSILNYVRRMRKHLVLDHASSETMFSSDSYVAQKKPKSVLCLPLLRQTELVGILYLENNLTTGAFTKDCLSVLELLASQAAISLENASLYSALAQENQDRRRAEQEVRKLNADLELRVLERTAQLQEANRELEAFSYSVSHDLRNPLRTIDGFSAALEEDHGERLEPDALDSLRRVRTAARWMSELIDNLLSLSRVTSGELRRETISMSAMVEEALADLRRASPDRKVECVVAPEVMVSADVRLLRIALDNLLGNAWKYTGKRTQARIEFGMREEEGQRVYYIRDNGAGFDMKFASKLFAPFQRMHTTEEFPGTGVGLATVQRIIRRHGGRIWVHTAIEEGATFSFTLQPEAELRK